MIVTPRFALPSSQFHSLQWSVHYKDLEVCKKNVDEDFDKVSSAIKDYLGKKFVSVLKMGCMTHEEAADLNTKLGH